MTIASGAHFFTRAATSASGCPSQPKSPITAKRTDIKLLEDELCSEDDSDEELIVDDELRSEDDSNEELIADEELRTEDTSDKELTANDELRTEDTGDEELTADEELHSEDDSHELAANDELRTEDDSDDARVDELIAEDIFISDELELIDGKLDWIGDAADEKPKATEELLRVTTAEDALGTGS